MTSNFQLDAKCRATPGFKGVYARDQLTFRPKRGMSVIMNLEPHTESGSHWVAVYFGSKYAYYFDPFGMPPPPEIERFIHRYSKPMAYESSDLQELTSSKCGQYCFYFVNEMAHGTPIYSVLYKLKQQPSRQNERFVQTYWNTHN